MKWVVFILTSSLFLIVSACGNTGSQEQESKYTQEDVKEIVLNHLTENFNKDKNEIKIMSVSNDSGEYIVEWEIEEHCEFGTITVDDQTGKVIEVEESNC
ncbi:hypothetical protein [Ornithinibacillus contaminans]|uniref:hypothetical protein n=1 Tax=Ornithinibacillus contaminans TaxID=694055 RepID=UPI00064D7F92|nr:hypothetical protein [Ornithinibacillus contaminans]